MTVFTYEHDSLRPIDIDMIIITGIHDCVYLWTWQLSLPVNMIVSAYEHDSLRPTDIDMFFYHPVDMIGFTYEHDSLFPIDIDMINITK